MGFSVFWCAEVCARFPKLAIGLGLIKSVNVEKENKQIRKLKETVYNKVRGEYNIETLKDNPTVRAYRDFYWKLDIDPTKTRPSGEALLRRVLHGNELPTISTVVDAYNLASMETIIPISGFDSEKSNPPFHVRFAENGETFVGIGMNKPLTLTDKMLVLADKSQILCVYPHRDSDRTKITEKTKDVLIIAYGAPEITKQQLKEAVEKTLSYIKLVSNGEIYSVKVFSVSSN
ncbi:MAG: B3/B4 domain-containing protein [Candidatus Bathycorpusculaceae bacterium]